MSQWFLIDQNGRRPIQKSPDFWSEFEYQQDEIWPDFAELVLMAKLEHIHMALQTWATTVGMKVQDVTESPDAWDSAVLIARNGSSYCLFEVPSDDDFALIHAESAELIAGLLSCHAAFFGAEESTGLVFVNTYDLGQIDVSWYDSVEPGPSFARVFHKNGSCTEEDPRAYALERMDMPATSPLLDRYAFVETMLSGLGLEEIRPGIDLSKVVCALRFTPVED